jgi:hypothetical protein
MTDQHSDRSDRTKRKDDATKTASGTGATDTPSTRPGHTDSGQEATRGKAPEQHDDEHQSNYGGGGPNGGSDGA